MTFILPPSVADPTPTKAVAEEYYRQPFIPPSADDGTGNEFDGLVSDHDNGSMLEVKIGKRLDSFEKVFERFWTRMQKLTPTDYSTAQSGTVDAANDNLVINLGTPDRGFYWEVHLICIGGADVNSSVAGTGSVYVAPTPQSSPGLAFLRDYSTSLPAVGPWGTRQLIVKDTEYLFVVVRSGGAGVTYVANMTATIYNVAGDLGDTVTVN